LTSLFIDLKVADPRFRGRDHLVAQVVHIAHSVDARFLFWSECGQVVVRWAMLRLQVDALNIRQQSEVQFKLHYLLDGQEVTGVDDHIAVGISLYLLLLFGSNFSFTECRAAIEMNQVGETLLQDLAVILGETNWVAF